MVKPVTTCLGVWNQFGVKVLDTLVVGWWEEA